VATVPVTVKTLSAEKTVVAGSGVMPFGENM
jgi:hypothetical protein